MGFSAVFKQDACKGFGGLFAALNGLFEEVVHLLFLEDVEGIRVSGEEIAKEGLTIALDQFHGGGDGIERGLEVFEFSLLPQTVDDAPQLFGDGGKVFGLSRESGMEVLELVESEALGELGDAIDDAVHLGDEGEDVVAVEWSDEGLIEAEKRFAEKLAGLNAVSFDVAELAVEVGETGNDAFELTGRIDDAVCELLQLVVKFVVSGKEVEHKSSVEGRMGTQITVL
jgi:hypothetical protein